MEHPTSAAFGMEVLCFPVGIGSGMAKGDWPDYFEAVEHFAQKNPQFFCLWYNHKIRVGA